MRIQRPQDGRWVGPTMKLSTGFESHVKPLLDAKVKDDFHSPEQLPSKLTDLQGPLPFPVALFPENEDPIQVAQVTAILGKPNCCIQQVPNQWWLSHWHGEGTSKLNQCGFRLPAWLGLAKPRLASRFHLLDQFWSISWGFLEHLPEESEESPFEKRGAVIT